MKNLKSYLCLLFGMLSLSLSAQSDALFEKTMEANLAKLDTAKNAITFQQCRNQFERIASKYTNEWLPIYYVAYCDIQIFFFDPKAENRQSILDDAKKKLSELEAKIEVDESEVNTLWGYYYNAAILLDPKVNGQKYYNEVITYYKKAISQNNKNPRPVLLYAFFEDKLPSFLRTSGNVYCEEMKKVEALFENERKSVNKPYWGKDFLKIASEKCK